MWKAEIYKAKFHAVNYLMKHNYWKEFLRKLLYLATAHSWAQLTNVGIYIWSPHIEITLNAISKESELLKGRGVCVLYSDLGESHKWAEIYLLFIYYWD